ncbi:SDR family NAD(P)-dependent oxidoreductase, partial [Candidatus Entotheonella palauensis]|uniref:SDR family NAD(P)-dependent oxidoreductase n=1 Tax=Candidatus Entotheonella palauensis TaxID=93172 RepID=UPI000B7C7910
MERLTNKVALVTGAAGGIGQAMIERLAQEGANIVAVDIDAGFVADTTTRIRALGRKIETLQADVSQLADIGRMIQHTVETMGRLDILMNNAGVIRFQELLDISSDDWDFVCNVNLKGAFFLLQAAARQMISQGDGGKIVNTASVSGKRPEPMFVHYGVSKAGVISMTKSAAEALGSHGINVNAVCPGSTVTNMHLTVTHALAERQGISLDDMIAQREAAIPTGRRNEPADIAAMAAFLASDDAKNIT